MHKMPRALASRGIKLGGHGRPLVVLTLGKLRWDPWVSRVTTFNWLVLGSARDTASVNKMENDHQTSTYGFHIHANTRS